MRRRYKHTLTVEVLSEVDRGQRLMQKRLIRWLEAYGHTASDFGFEFRRVGVITGAFIGSNEKDEDNG